MDPTRITKSKPLVPDNHTIMLLISEIQQIPDGKETETAKVLLDLHGGSNKYPILPILVRIPNRSDVLSRTGLYRFRTEGRINLQPLAPNENGGF